MKNKEKELKEDILISINGVNIKEIVEFQTL
jgi:hypothetical protein